MAGFVLPQVLNATQILILHGLRVENPPFYPMLAAIGFSGLPDLSQMDAITFCDVVASHVPLTDGLLFHELVHVEQYRQLGLQRFSELYVRGFLSGGGYDGIPLEVNKRLTHPNICDAKFTSGSSPSLNLLNIKQVTVVPNCP